MRFIVHTTEAAFFSSQLQTPVVGTAITLDMLEKGIQITEWQLLESKNKLKMVYKNTKLFYSDLKIFAQDTVRNSSFSN